MLQIRINDQIYEVPEGITIKEACKIAGVYIPSLCYHADVPSGGICGLCVVKVDGSALAYSCMTKVRPGLIISTTDKEVLEKQQKHFDQFMDVSHPPPGPDIEEVMNYLFPKKTIRIRQAEKANAISFYPEKCIECQICIRMCGDVVDIGALDDPTVSLKGGKCISCGQCTLTCSTNSLTETSSIPKVLSHLVSKEAKFLLVDPEVLVSTNDSFSSDGLVGQLCIEKVVGAARKLGFKYVFDNRYSNDLISLEMTHELLDRIDSKGVLPLINSNCPALVNFIEKSNKDLIPNLSSIKPPAHILARAIRRFVASGKKEKPDSVFIVHLTGCVAAKDQVKRMQLTKDIDEAITVREFVEMINMFGIDWNSVSDSEFDQPFTGVSGASSLMATSGGLTTSILRNIHERFNGNVNLTPEMYSFVPKLETNLSMETIKIGSKELNIAICNGIASFSQLISSPEMIQNIHFVEVMTCQGGCINGGGLPKLKTRKLAEPRIKRIKEIDIASIQMLSAESNGTYIDMNIKLPLFKHGEGLSTHYEPQERANNQNKKKLLVGIPMVMYGSNKGKSTRYARLVASFLHYSSSSMNSVTLDVMKKRRTAIFIISTFGNGCFPQNAAKFYQLLTTTKEDISSVEYAILGIGDSNKGPTYCAAALKLDEQLKKMGAKPIMDLVKLNSSDPDGGDATYADWSQKLSEVLGTGKPRIGMAFLNKLQKIEDKTVHEKPSRPIGFEIAEIIEKQIVSPPDFHPRLTKITIKLPEGLTYEVGDHVAILPCNDVEVAESVISALQYAKSDVFNINSGDAIIPAKVTVMQLFTQYLDLNGPPTTSLYQTFYNSAMNDDAKKAIEPLLKEESPERMEYDKTHNTGEVIKELAKNSKPSLDALVSCISHITPRLYSAASSPETQPDTVDIYANEVIFDDGKRYGLCTHFLVKKEHVKVAIAFRRGKFKYPRDIESPIIMFALGTGFSPMIPLIVHRQQLLSEGKKIGPAFLVFGSKYRGSFAGLIMKIEGFKKDGLINETFYAHSRDDNKMHIQDILKKYPSKFWELWQEPKTCVFYCGPERGIPDELKDILLEITIAEGWLSREEAMAYNSRHDWHIEGI
ncbi:Iron only hydrogenase large subunit, C-terminal domain containing protein [Tritrichomonas foetus]|uniref:NADPH--hemoprotein reductase n=1 Tax=Tritrichomonas foetus TaxID=1144522 RepID=A0A1J4KGX9_9EUKA|nr:Iron only hydrogenase large subunit, C-terminal domain containing protein [Tritrichomonas foetus]|eukprot:OHT10208.1 Iron only hydrogenase large subunit, C-terminal domain containing protein [Tritrichomonas foetus]